jgi:hypothetical protein
MDLQDHGLAYLLAFRLSLTGFIKSHLRVSDVVTLYESVMFSFLFPMGIKRLVEHGRRETLIKLTH